MNACGAQPWRKILFIRLHMTNIAIMDSDFNLEPRSPLFEPIILEVRPDLI
jgi:hypothetical protein